MVRNNLWRLAIGALLFTAGAQAQDSAKPSPTSPSPNGAGGDASAPGPSGDSSAGNSPGGGSGDPSAGNSPPAAPPPEATSVPDSSSPDNYKPNINLTLSPLIVSPYIDRAIDAMFYGNSTHLATFGEWNWTTSNPPLNLSTGAQSLLSTVNGSFHANPNRRSWGMNNVTQQGFPDGVFPIGLQLTFAGTRAILRGGLVDANWDNSTRSPVRVVWLNTTAQDYAEGSRMAKPIRIQNVTSAFPPGIFYDTGDLPFGRYAFSFELYSGTLELDGMDIETGFVSEYPSLEEVPTTTIHAVDPEGKTNSFFAVQGNSKPLNETLGEVNGSTVEWNSLDYDGMITFTTQPNATYMILNGTIGPEYDTFQVQILPVPPAGWVMGNDGNRYAYAPYRNPSPLYSTPLDPKVQYKVMLQGGIMPNVNHQVPQPGPGNIHSVTFFAGTKVVDPPSNNTSAGASGDGHGESRASRNVKIIGGAVGGGVGLLLILGLFAFCCIRRKRKPSPVVSDPTPFEIDGSGNGATRVPSEDDDELADKVPEELTPAQLAKAREAGFLGAGGAGGDGPRRWTWRQPPSGPATAFDSALHPPASEAGVSAVPSSALDPRGAVPFTRGPASAVPSSVMIPHLAGPGSIAASSSLEPSDAVDSRFYGASSGAGSSTGAGWSSAILSPTSTQVNGVAVKDVEDPAAILATPVHGDKRVHQAEDGGAVDDDENVDMIPPSYNPSWASRGAGLADSGAVNRVATQTRAATAVAEDNGAAEIDEALEAPPPIEAGRLSIDSETFGRAA